MTDKTADLAGPGLGDYGELAQDLPDGYEALLPPMERMKTVFAVKNYIEANLCKELNLNMVQVPLIVDKDSGVNDYLDRDGSRTPVEFPCGLGLDTPHTSRAAGLNCSRYDRREETSGHSAGFARPAALTVTCEDLMIGT